MGKLWRRIYFLLNQRRLERELAEEMAAHQEMMPAESRSGFGNTAKLHEISRETWSWKWLEDLRIDLKYGIQSLFHAPGFTIGAVAVLALGAGVNLAEFQIFDGMIFHRLTIRDAATAIQFSRSSKPGPREGFTGGELEFYRSHNKSFAWLVSEDTSPETTVDGDTGLHPNLVSANYFSGLGVRPLYGRLPGERDGEPGAPIVAALGYNYWRTRWAGDPNIIGRIIHVDNTPVAVVGVLPGDFDGLSQIRTHIWLPAAVRSRLFRDMLPVQQDFARASEVLYGKIKPGVSLAAAEAELNSLSGQLKERRPAGWPADGTIQGRPVRESLKSLARKAPGLGIFIVMVLLVLLSACANLGNMLLARGLARQREISIRISLGAGRERIVRQLMTENFLLAILGTIAGLVSGATASRLLLAALNVPDIRLPFSWQLVVTGFTLTFVSTVVFGLPAALHTAHRGSRKVRLRQGLVGAQAAVSCLLLIASGVLVHNGIVRATVNIAFDYRNMAVVHPQLYLRKPTITGARQELQAISKRLGELPGVDGVTTLLALPLGPRMLFDTEPGLPRISRNAVAASYFAVMNLPFARGRTFLAGEEKAVIVSEAAARAVWPNEDAVGKIWKLAGLNRTVVGVVRNSGANQLADPESIEVYLPMEGRDFERASVIVHTRGDPAPRLRVFAAAAELRGENVSVRLLRSVRENQLAGEARLTMLIGSIGAVATALAAAGMFALVAFAANQRRRELGIRIAIGAPSSNILAVLLGQNLRATLIGVVAGTLLAIVLTKVVRSVITGIVLTATPIPGFVLGLAGFAVAAMLATLSPAMRALRIDPSATLREE